MGSEMCIRDRWDIGRPGNVKDLTLMTRIEDVTEMLGDVITSLPEGDEEE